MPSVHVLFHRFGIASLILLSSCQALGAIRNDEFVAYRVKGDWPTDVYELARDELTQGGPEIIGPGRLQSEFRGQIFRCDDQNYLCYVSGLVVAIPRSGSPASWTAGRNECRVLDAPALLADRVVRILCRVDTSHSVEFSYSRERGIISYRRQCPMCIAGEYELVGQIGLFSSSETHR